VRNLGRYEKLDAQVPILPSSQLPSYINQSTH